jgi:hypothetical protein
VALLEEEFAALRGRALLPCGGFGRICAGDGAPRGPGDRVLSNAFTLAPVPGAIARRGVPVVGVTRALTIDLDDRLRRRRGRRRCCC